MQLNFKVIKLINSFLYYLEPVNKAECLVFFAIRGRLQKIRLELSEKDRILDSNE